MRALPRLTGVVLLIGYGSACRTAPVEPAPQEMRVSGGVSPTRLARLSRGLNVARWFNAWGSEKPPLRYNLSDDDLAAIRRLGFTAIRLIFDPRQFRHPAKPSALDQQTLGDLDRALNRLLAHDLAVILTPYSHGKYFISDSASAAAFAQFWEALARHVSDFDADRVFLEVANEPPLTPERWEPLQWEILAAMRRGAPRHTLIASGASWSTVRGLVAIPPVPDSNVVYTFHIYEPWVFTHQGVPWNEEKPLAGLLPYPNETKRCRAALGVVTVSAPLADARDYCAGRWDAGALAGLLDQAVQWRQTHGVALFAGELGAYCAAPTTDRLEWFSDVRLALEQRQIGWALWEWDGCFGLNARHTDAGKLVLDTAVAAVLGLDLHDRPVEQ